MAKILITSFYQDKNPTRHSELEHCMKCNLANPHIDSIVVFLEGKEADFHVLNDPKIVVIESPRPTFQKFFETANQISGDNDILIIANTDIYFDESIKILPQIKMDNVALALSRWHYYSSDRIELYNEKFSQDVWIFKGKIKPIEFCNFFMGIRGCDNRIAYELKKAGYAVFNPAKTIRSIHYHMSEVRNYGPEIIPKPYWPLPVISI